MCIQHLARIWVQQGAAQLALESWRAPQGGPPAVMSSGDAPSSAPSAMWVVKEAFSSTIAFFKAERNFKMRWLHDDGFVGYSQMSSEKSVKVVRHRKYNKNRDYFVNMHQDSGTPKGTSLHRFNYYPEPTRGRESSTGFAAHRDLTTLTLLFSNDSEGFQICDPSGQWVDVPFVPGTILLLAGEFLHFYSNKRFIPVMHKVVVPSENHPGYRPRCSLIYFEYADDDTPMWPPGDDPASPDSPAPPSVKELLEKRLFKARVEGAKYTSS
ncbi:Gibberellin 2-beta-dioxygenase 3 [Chionoecetes opilio]|uniref:Gibberellin 2-beta-dioxygenase 3 n=1 Tax=Chionoecetes opilio TaxID=41210 RepID=A0A8J4YMF4_CHIOP|nr:Gibberellin 2-beta-dioxygenase 3 [Chionoecetes opilio]